MLVDFHGGSKPPPYTAKNKFDIYCFTPSVIFLRKNDSPLKDEAEVQIEFDIEFVRNATLSIQTLIS